MHNEKLGRSVNIVNIFLKHAKGRLDEQLGDAAQSAKQREWDDLIDSVNEWMRRWGTSYPTFTVRPRHPRAPALHRATPPLASIVCRSHT